MLPVRALYVPASDRSESVISQCCCVLSDDLSDANKVPVHLDVSNHARLVHVDKANISSSFLFLRFICLKVRVTEEEKVDRKRGRGEGKRERETFHILVRSPNSHSGHGRAKSMSRNFRLHLSLLLTCRDPITRALYHFPRYISR